MFTHKEQASLAGITTSRIASENSNSQTFGVLS
jgi:hypothetical protein